MLKKLIEKKMFNTLTYMIGSLSYGFTSLIFMIIINRLLGIDAVGQYSFAFAVGAVFYTIGVYFGMTYQVTDVSNQYSDSDYIFNRITTCIIMLLISALFLFIKNYNVTKTLLILLLVFYRGFDALYESFHAIIQRNDKIYKIGCLILLRTVFLIFAFLIFTLLFHKLIISVISIVIVDLLTTFIAEYPIVKQTIKTSKFNVKKNMKLLVLGFPVFILTFLAMYILNSPKYLIDNMLNDKLQGIFGIVFMPSSFMSMVSIYFIHPFLNEISFCIKNSDYKKLSGIILKISGFIFIFGLLVSLVAYLIGIPVLEIMYDIKLSGYRLDLLIIMLGTIFYSLYALFSSLLIAMRKNIHQVVLLLITSVIATIVCYVLIKSKGLFGASIAYSIIMFVQLVLHVLVYTYYACTIKKDKK